MSLDIEDVCGIDGTVGNEVNDFSNSFLKLSNTLSRFDHSNGQAGTSPVDFCLFSSFAI
jgi:hypothetical protein